jgi:hypothetical protein
VGQTTSGKKRTAEVPDSSPQRKRRAKQSVRKPCHESDGERTSTDEDVENEVVSFVYQSLHFSH